MKKPAIFFLCCLLFCVWDARPHQGKTKMMWLDCSANWERFSHPDSIAHYVRKCREAGITALVLDVKGTSGEVVYPSRYAAQKKEWKGVVRPDFDFVGTFIGHARCCGLEIYASVNTFAEGTGVFKRGPIYEDKAGWQSVNYLPGRGLVPSLEIEGKQVLFTNPALPEVQRHELDVLRELAELFEWDGIILDRGRYDNIQSDFSDFSRLEFEKYAGVEVRRWPEAIYEWVEDGEGGYDRLEGPYFKKWIEWRASVIYGFFEKARQEIKEARPGIKFGAYTGAWYPSYYEVGVNWASRDYDPSLEYDWATPEYKDYGYAELLDIYTNGNYYRNVSIEDYRRSNGLHMNETDSRYSRGDHLSVEGACIFSRSILGDNPFLGGLYVEDYRNDPDRFMRAVEMNLKMSDGLMVFDIVHIINFGWWDQLADAIRRAGE